MTYTKWKSLAKDDWKTQPISPICQVGTRVTCGLPTEKAYPAMGGGWMSLCFKHGLKHKEAFPIEDLIAGGEIFE